MITFYSVPAVVKTDNTIGFNVIPPVITPVLASKMLSIFTA